MRTVTLPGTSLAVSRIVFGTAGLFNLRGGAARARLLDAAVDHGFTHFDTAPLYGFGIAERALGELRRRDRRVTVTTKVGLYAPGGEDQRAPLAFARKVLGRLAPTVSRARPDVAIARARASLDASLRRLGGDHVDLLLVHELAWQALDRDAWTAWLEKERRRGRIGAFGIAARAADLSAIAADSGALAAVVQALDSLADREAEPLLHAGRPLQITYGYVTAARRRDPHASVTDTLAAALRRNRTGAIVVSTRRIARLRQYADVLAQGDAAQ